MGSCLDCYGEGTPSGGRGGTVLTVGTSDPAGDLQDFLSNTHAGSTGPNQRRIIKWHPDLADVALGIDSTSIDTTAGNLTVTPMPKGVYVTNNGTQTAAAIQIQATNCLFIGWRGRCGPSFDSGTHSGKSKCVQIANKANNIRFTHSSFMFDIDKFSITAGGAGSDDAKNITIDHSIFGWGLFIADPPQDEVYAGTEDDHSRCCTFQSEAGGGGEVLNLTLAYNLYGGYDRRVPGNTIGASYDARYNLFGLSGRYGSRLGWVSGQTASQVNYVGNFVKLMDDWTGDSVIYTNGTSGDSISVYAHGNRIVNPDGNTVFLHQDFTDEGFVSSTPHDFAPVPWKLVPGDTIESYVLANAGPCGAGAHEDAWDALMKAQWVTGDIPVIDDPTDLGASYALDTPTLPV